MQSTVELIHFCPQLQKKQCHSLVNPISIHKLKVLFMSVNLVIIECIIYRTNPECPPGLVKWPNWKSTVLRHFSRGNAFGYYSNKILNITWFLTWRFHCVSCCTKGTKRLQDVNSSEYTLGEFSKFRVRGEEWAVLKAVASASTSPCREAPDLHRGLLI